MALLLVLMFLPSAGFTPLQVAYAEEPGSGGPDPTVISGNFTISEGGVYQLDPVLAGKDITVETSDPVTLIGNGVGDFTAADANTGIGVTGYAEGIDLTLQDVSIINNYSSKSVINLTGGENQLTIQGTNLLELEEGGGGSLALVHVPDGVSLDVRGAGTLYFYKSSQGAGFGSNRSEKSGDMAFSELTLFGKATKPGPAIGNGATFSGAPGNITFNSGEYTLIGNAMGACIGGGSGGGGGTPANPGGNVYINGGSFSINVDWAGAAIGGGGYAGGNDAAGGNLIITGGSLRTVCDQNALPNWASAGVTEYGVTDKVITALKLNASNEPVYALAFDTSLLSTQADSFTVTEGEATLYVGEGNHYKFVNEEKNKDPDVYEVITSTDTNWVGLVEPNLYLYLTGEDHTLTVNGEAFTATFDEAASTFSVEVGGTDPDPSVDYSWYNAEDTAFTLTSKAQFIGFANIVNNKQESSEAGAVTGTDPTVPADDFAGKTVTLAVDVDLGGVEVTAGGFNEAGVWAEPVWTGDEWTPIARHSSSGLHAVGSDNGLYGRPFKGTFDGGFHEITGMYVPYYGTGDDSAEGNSHGLFGDLGQAGVVKNIIVKSGFVKGARFTGGIVGRNWGGVETSANYATIQANGRGGGGGITGVNYDNGHDPYVLSCINYGQAYNIKLATAGTPSAGGITATTEGKIINCLNVGKVGTGGVSNLGGIAGVGAVTFFENSYYLEGAKVTSPSRADSAYAKTAAEIKTAAFAELLGPAFVYIHGDWPRLADGSVIPPWVGEPGSGDLDGDGEVAMLEVVTALQVVVSGGGLEPEQIAALDVDGDGALTMADVIKILRIVAGL
jgi:hypothetical protein